MKAITDRYGNNKTKEDRKIHIQVMCWQGNKTIILINVTLHLQKTQGMKMCYLSRSSMNREMRVIASTFLFINK